MVGLRRFLVQGGGRSFLARSRGRRVSALVEFGGGSSLQVAAVALSAAAEDQTGKWRPLCRQRRHPAPAGRRQQVARRRRSPDHAGGEDRGVRGERRRGEAGSVTGRHRVGNGNHRAGTWASLRRSNFDRASLLNHDTARPILQRSSGPGMSLTGPLLCLVRRVKRREPRH
jgi:hypothetical protein